MKYMNSVEVESVSNDTTILFEMQQASFPLHDHTS